MKTLSQTFKLALLAAVLVVASACSSDKNRGANVVRARMPGQFDNTMPGTWPNQGGWPNQSGMPTQNQNVGTISGQNIMQMLELFVGPGVLGQINQFSSSNNGVTFTGNVDSYGRSGQVSIIIWDSFAQQLGPYVVQMKLNPQLTNYNNNVVNLVFQDEFGTLTFQGSFTQTMFSGQVGFQNKDGASGTLGQFQVGACSFVRCR
jgi:hypothetical protein